MLRSRAALTVGGCPGCACLCYDLRAAVHSNWPNLVPGRRFLGPPSPYDDARLSFVSTLAMLMYGYPLAYCVHHSTAQQHLNSGVQIRPNTASRHIMAGQTPQRPRWRAFLASPGENTSAAPGDKGDGSPQDWPATDTAASFGALDPLIPFLSFRG